MQTSNHVRSGGVRVCSHCQCSTVSIGSKLFSDYMNLGGPDAGNAVHLKPTILEAITLIFGFRMPPPDVVINTSSGLQYFDTWGHSYRSLSLCMNCESVLINLYKVFLLFTELSNGRESFVLKNSIISGRMNKEEEVIPLDSFTAGKGTAVSTYVGNSQVTISPYPSSASGTILMNPANSNSNLNSNNSNLSTIRRELSSDVIAEMYVPNTNQPTGVTITPILTTVTHQSSNSAGSMPTPVTNTPTTTADARTNSIKTSEDSRGDKRRIEIITLDEEDASPRGSTAVTRPTPAIQTPNTIKAKQRFVPFQASTPTAPPPGASRTVIVKNTKKRTEGRILENRLTASIITTPAMPSNTQRSIPHQTPGVQDPLVGSLLTSPKGIVTRGVTTKSAKHKCMSCPLHFPTLVSLLSHAYREHGKGRTESRGRIYKCSECPSTFNSSVSLTSHAQCHRKDYTRFLCKTPGCGKGYSELRLLRRHATMSGHVGDSTGGKIGTGKPNTIENESDYWTSGIEVIHDPEQVMKKLEATTFDGNVNRNAST